MAIDKYRRLRNVTLVTLLVVTTFLAVWQIQPIRFWAYQTFKISSNALLLDATTHPVEVFADLPYCHTQNPDQTLDLYLPKRRSYSTPLVVYIHGGGWRSGSKSNSFFAFHKQSWTEKGYAVASLNYRLGSKNTFPSPNRDIECAFKYLANQSEVRVFSESTWAIVGDSAGAQLGSLAISDSSSSQRIKAFVGFYGPYDLTIQLSRKPRQDRDAYNYTNKGNDANRASPIDAQVNRTTRYFLLHGIKDKVVPYQQSELYSQKLRASGAHVETLISHDAGHDFSMFTQPNNAEVRIRVANFLRASFDDTHTSQ